MDTRTAVWVSTAEKFSKSFWEKLGNFLESLEGSQRQLCIKTRPLNEELMYIQTLLQRGGLKGRMYETENCFRESGVLPLMEAHLVG